MNDSSLENEVQELKRILTKEIKIDTSVMESELIRMGVIIPIDASPDWIAQRLSEEIATKISEN